MAIIIALLAAAALSTGSTIFYFLHKRREKERVYGIVLKKAGNNVIYIGYQGRSYPIHVSNSQYDTLEIRSKIAIKVWFNEPSGNVSIFLDC